MKTIINPANFTKTTGAYSQGVKINLGNQSMILISGQLAMDAAGNPVAPTDIQAQTKYIFENIKTILHEAGSSIDDVVKAQIFLTDISQFSKVSAVRNEYFETIRPVSTMVEISRTVKEGCDIEIEVMAITENQKDATRK